MMEQRKIFASLEGKAPEELFGELRTPCYIIDEKQLQKNGEILASVMERDWLLDSPCSEGVFQF